LSQNGKLFFSDDPKLFPMKRIFYLFIPLLLAGVSCGNRNSQKEANRSKLEQMVKLMTVDSGHFHAALVQKSMYEQVSPNVHVYAPEGTDLQQHLDRINSYNSRSVSPTTWKEIVYTGPDFFEKMISEKPGNVVILAGNNRKKAEYIERSVQAGLNVLADKPMIINSSDFPKLEESFRIASEKGILLYDIMTERYEITTILQKALSQNPEIFGRLVEGTEKDPAVTKVSVHHFAKNVSGVSLVRPAWFFDTDQQGEGIVDVTTHLVDLVQWECFPGQVLNKSDIEIAAAGRWPTILTLQEFRGVTGLSEFPPFLMKDVKNGNLNVISNGEFTYRIKGIWAKVSVEWRYQAPEGGGDTHYSVMKGSKCDLVIRQAAEEKFQPALYVENIKDGSIDDFSKKLVNAVRLMPYDSLSVEKVKPDVLRINIPARYRVSHEEHFAQVMAKFLDYLKEGKLPEWEVAGMITKYFTTTSALKLAKEK
jgi:predicted dehydrogenase